MNRYNFVVVLKTNLNKERKVVELSEFKPDRSVSDVGWVALSGSFNENDISRYEYYPLSVDWQTLSGWKDMPL